MIPLWRFCIAASHYSAFLSLADHQGWTLVRIHHFKVVDLFYLPGGQTPSKCGQ